MCFISDRRDSPCFPWPCSWSRGQMAWEWVWGFWLSHVLNFSMKVHRRCYTAPSSSRRKDVVGTGNRMWGFTLMFSHNLLVGLLCTATEHLLTSWALIASPQVPASLWLQVEQVWKNLLSHFLPVWNTPVLSLLRFWSGVWHLQLSPGAFNRFSCDTFRWANRTFFVRGCISHVSVGDRERFTKWLPGMTSVTWRALSSGSHQPACCEAEHSMKSMNCKVNVWKLNFLLRTRVLSEF